MEKQVYKIFGKVLVSDKPKMSFYHVNAISIDRGIFVPRNLCYKWLYDLICKTDIDYNTTFYKDWEDIVSKHRGELFLDQLQNYASTYGTDFTGEAWVPNDESFKDFDYKNLKVLEGITLDEVIAGIQKLAYSGIALSEDTLEFLEENSQYIDINKIQNRQLRLMCLTEDSSFRDGQECLLWIMYKFFNISMLVKSKEILESLHPKAEMLSALDKNKVLLSSVFYRNKNVFMCFKKAPELHTVINKIRKLAVKHHKPMPKSPWLCLSELTSQERDKLFRNAPIFKLVQIYNALSNPTGYYVIRNGKAYFKDTLTRDISPRIINQLLLEIISRVPEVESVTLPKGIELAMPTSEKNFIGEVPLGSYINCATNNTMIGIYWENSWGARDLDLHARTIDGNAIGWYAGYKGADNDIIFSGDMTNADPCATEVMWFKKQPTNAIVSVNKYSGNSQYKYKLFIAQEEATDFKKGYMVDPNNVIYETEMSSNGFNDVTLGYFQDGNFVFHSCNIGNGIVPNCIREKILKHLMECRYLTLRKVLELAGIKIVDDADIKLSSKADLINFFSGSK